MITISLCMIVRDEETVLGRCLDSLQPIADEIVIVDTGSLDNTKAMASHYTDRIYDFTWIDDFAAARNYAFSLATQEYCMWADADDVLPEAEREKLLYWKAHTHSHRGPDVVMMKYATAFDNKGKPSFFYERERLLKRECGFQWQGRVHEAIVPSGRIQHLDIFLEHRSVKTHYSQRNLRIYEKMRQTWQDFTPRDLFYYGRELYYHQRYGDAIGTFQDFLSQPEGFVENQVEACRLAAYCCYPLGQEQQAVSFLLQGLRYRVPGGELCCDLGQHYFDRQDYEQAAFWFESALHAPKKAESGAFIQEECYGFRPCINLSICYDQLGDAQKALAFHRQAEMMSDREPFLNNI